jgi:hypothetical protein
MRTRLLFLSLGSAAALAAATAWAQTPTPVEPGQQVEGKLSAESATLPDGSAHACYAINTKAGDQIALSLQSDMFPGRLTVGRGPSCATAAMQFDKTGAEGKDAQVGFKAAGGRYVIAVRAAKPDAAGAFRLNVKAVLALAGEPTPGGANPGVGPAAPPSARKLAMLAQVDKRAAEIAAQQERQRLIAEQAQRDQERLVAQIRANEAEAAARRAEEEAEEEAERASRPQVNLAQTFANSFNKAMADNAAENARQQQMLDNLAAQQRAASAAREARERAEQVRQDTARREAARAQYENQQALARQLAEANAVRRQQAVGADAATRQRLAEQSQSAAQAAQAIGGGQTFQQRQTELSAEASAQRAAEAQAQERQRRLDQQRALEVQRQAEQQRLADAQRRQQQAAGQSSLSTQSRGSGVVIAQNTPPPASPATRPPPWQTPIPATSPSSSKLACPAAQRRSTPEELMVSFKYAATREAALAELNKKQSGLYDVQCTANDFGWQCQAKYKTGKVKEFCVGGVAQ